MKSAFVSHSYIMVINQKQKIPKSRWHQIQTLSYISSKYTQYNSTNEVKNEQIVHPYMYIHTNQNKQQGIQIILINQSPDPYDLFLQLLISFSLVLLHLGFFPLRGDAFLFVVVKLSVLLCLVHLCFCFVILFFQFSRPDMDIDKIILLIFKKYYPVSFITV